MPLVPGEVRPVSNCWIVLVYKSGIESLDPSGSSGNFEDQSASRLISDSDSLSPGRAPYLLIFSQQTAIADTCDPIAKHGKRGKLSSYQHACAEGGSINPMVGFIVIGAFGSESVGTMEKLQRHKR